MKKNTKGFTLIELLAVIVILAIIALIAVPVIMNIINKANKSAFKDTAYGVIQAGELYYAEQLLEPNGMQENVTITLPDTTKKLQIKGEVPTGSILITTEGKVAIAVQNGRYCVTKGLEDDKVTMTEDIANCTLPSGVAVTPKNSLNEYSWDEIQALASKGLTTEEYQNTYNLELGAKKDDKYILVDYDSYGGFVFMFNSGTSAPINTSATNAGGYASSAMKTTVDGLYSTLPAELQTVISTIDIKCNDGVDNYKTTHTVEDVKLFLPSIREVSVTQNQVYDGRDYTPYLDAEGSTFDYFDNSNERINRNNICSSSHWWLRSATGIAVNTFWFVNTSSHGFNFNTATGNMIVVPAFVVGENGNIGAASPKTLNDYTWAEIQAIAKSTDALSDYNIKIGDTKTENDVTYRLVSDERTSVKANANANYNGLVFMFYSGKNFIMNSPPPTNVGGYANSAIKGTVDNIYNNLGNAELKAIIKEVSVNCNDGSGTPTEIHPVNAHMFLPSVRELSGTQKFSSSTTNYLTLNNALDAEGSTFDYFAKYVTEKTNRTNAYLALTGWTRSACGDNSINFWYVGSYGDFGSTNSMAPYAVVPAFVIG